MSTLNSFLSIEDDLDVEIQIHFPLKNNDPSKSPPKHIGSSKQGPIKAENNSILAILLHPYGPLGGSKDDHVIRKLSAQLVQRNIIVATPNMRGVGNSQGRTSWTAYGECTDLKAILQAFLLPNKGSMWDNPVISQTLKENFDYSYSEIILIGYSFGAMISSSVTLNTISEIISLRHSDREGICCPTLSTILLSYPLGVAWALSLWKVYEFKTLFAGLVSSINASSESASIGRLLIIFGGKDQFTSYSSYKNWVQEKKIELQADECHEGLLGYSPVQARSNSQADHFWARAVDKDWLVQEILCWLEN